MQLWMARRLEKIFSTRHSVASVTEQVHRRSTSIQDPATKMHPVYESGWYRIQEQFQEIQVSIQVMIDRWPGNSQCPRQVTRKLKVTRRDTCRVMWPGNSMCPLKRTPSADKMTPPADRRTPAIQCHPGILNINHWKWGFGHQSHSPPLL